jgi:hypothetical protein
VLPNGDKTAPRGLADLTERITFGQALLENPDLRIHETAQPRAAPAGRGHPRPGGRAGLRPGGWVELQVLAHNENGTAVLLEYGSLRVLVPGGVGLGELLKQDQAFQPSVLVLSGRDLKETGESQWRQLEPLTVVATLTGEGENWLNLDQVGWVQLVSDGEQMWLEVER